MRYGAVPTLLQSQIKLENIFLNKKIKIKMKTFFLTFLLLFCMLVVEVRYGNVELLEVEVVVGIVLRLDSVSCKPVYLYLHRPLRLYIAARLDSPRYFVDLHHDSDYSIDYLVA